MRVLGLKELANVIHSLYAIEACRPPFGSCRRPRDDHGGAGCTGEGRSRATAACSERDEARAEAANAQADLSSQEALIAHLKLAIEKLRRAIYGSRSERQVRLLDQLELQLEELEAAATEDQLAAEAAAAQTQTVRSFQRKRPVRKPFPADIERERVVIEAPTSCACCGGSAAGQAGRRYHRDAGRDPAPLQGDRDGAREVHLPGLRGDHPAAGAVPCDAARLHRAAASGDDPVRQVRLTLTAQPSEPALQMRRHRSVGLDAGRPGRRRRLCRDAAVPADRSARDGRRTAAR